MSSSRESRPTTVLGLSARASDVRSSVLTVLAAYVASRLVVLAAVAVAHLLEPDRSWSRLFAAWDGFHYRTIAADGYDGSLPGLDGSTGPPTAAFFPLFPLLVRVASALTGTSLTAAGVVLNHLLGVVAVACAYLLARRHLDEAAAVRSAVLLAVLPGAGIVSMLYAEALLLALAAGCLLALDHGRWATAGLLGALATATRPSGAALAAAAVVYAWRARRAQSERGGVLAVALVPVGGLAYLGYLWQRTGRPTAWFELERHHWHQRLDGGWGFVARFTDLDSLSRPEQPAMLLGFLIVAWAAWLVLHDGIRLPPGVAAYTLAAVAQMLLWSAVGPRPRMLLAAFPLTWLFARRLSGRAFLVLVTGSLLTMVLVTHLYVRELLLP